MSYFSKNLRYLREQRNLKPSELANQLKVNQSTISRWENEDMGGTVDNAYDVANFFDVSIEDLTGKDMSKSQSNLSSTEILFDKTKDILSDDDRATIEFIMKKTIDNYEKNKNNQ